MPAPTFSTVRASRRRPRPGGDPRLGPPRRRVARPDGCRTTAHSLTSLPPPPGPPDVTPARRCLDDPAAPGGRPVPPDLASPAQPGRPLPRTPRAAAANLGDCAFAQKRAGRAAAVASQRPQEFQDPLPGCVSVVFAESAPAQWIMSDNSKMRSPGPDRAVGRHVRHSMAPRARPPPRWPLGPGGPLADGLTPARKAQFAQEGTQIYRAGLFNCFENSGGLIDPDLLTSYHYALIGKFL